MLTRENHTIPAAVPSASAFGIDPTGSIESEDLFCSNPDKCSDDTSTAGTVSETSSVYSAQYAESQSQVPSMSRSGPSEDESSVSTGLASDMSRRAILPIEPNGQTVAPQPRSKPFECAFQWQGCSYLSDVLEEWKEHCMSHFRGHEPPREFSCPFCDARGALKDGRDAWNMRLDHVARHHVEGVSAATARPDRELVEFLRKKKLISNEECKRLRRTKQAIDSRWATMNNNHRRPPQPTPQRS